MADTPSTSIQSYLSSRRFIILLLFSVIVTRLPLLVTGYGSDGDAWRVAFVADNLWKTGSYQVSRFPGYPLFEITTAPVVELGRNLDPPYRALYSNAAALLATLILILVWERIVRRSSNRPKLLVATFAFAPLLWLNSAATMDYVWSLLFIMLSFDAIQRKRIITAGIWLGAAAGFRPPNLVAVIPLLTLLRLDGASPRILLRFLAATAASTLVAFFPVLFTYGLIGWIQNTRLQLGGSSSALGDHVLSFAYRCIYAIGPLATLVAASILFSGRADLKYAIRDGQPVAVTAVVGLLTFIALFFAFPIDRSYLLPALPFLLLLVDRLSTTQLFKWFSVCLMAHSLINIDVIQHRGVRGDVGFDIHAGLVVEEFQKRLHMLDERDRIANLDLHGKAIVMTGSGPVFWFQNDNVELDTLWKDFNDPVVRRRTEPDVHFIPLLTKAELERVRSAGYAIYCTQDAREYVEWVTRYTMDEAGVILVSP
jgi:hypothetical protein